MSALDQLTESFRRFPGIGPRQAERFAYHLLQEEPSALASLAQQILRLRKETNRCTRCHRFFPLTANYEELCLWCGDEHHDQSMLMVVARDSDLKTMQKVHSYDGYYFVLGGTLVLGGQESAPGLRIPQLLERVRNEVNAGALREIILAFSTNTEGNHTADYIEQALLSYKQKGLTISRLGRGLGTGAEVEYADTETIRNALENRR